MGSGTTFSSGSLPALPPQSPGVAAYSPSARRKKKKPAVLPTRRASLRPTWETRMIHPTKKVGLDDSRKTGGRASGGLGARPQSCVLAGPWPHGPETGRFQKRRQRRQLFLSRPA